LNETNELIIKKLNKKIEKIYNLERNNNNKIEINEIEKNNEKEEENIEIVNNENKFYKIKNEIFKNEIFSSFIPIMTCLIYGFVGTINISFDQIVNIWYLLDYNKGGIGFNTIESKICLLLKVGLTIAFSGLMYILLQLIIKKIIDLFNLKNTFLLGSFFLIPYVMIYTKIIRFFYFSYVLLWLVILALVSYKIFCFQFCYVSIFVLINNSVKFENLGKVN
jgi:hypothetical protein